MQNIAIFQLEVMMRDLQEAPKSGEKQEPEVAPGRDGPMYSTL